MKERELNNDIIDLFNIITLDNNDFSLMFKIDDMKFLDYTGNLISSQTKFQNNDEAFDALYIFQDKHPEYLI